MRTFLVGLIFVLMFGLGTVEAGNKFDKAHGEKKESLLIPLNPKILQNADLPLVEKKGEGRFDCALAMNVHSEEFPGLREKISAIIGRPLTFFKQWNPDGEAHVTVITPLEYYDVLRGTDSQKPILSMDQIGAIASESEMQKSELEVLSLGSGRKLLDGKMEETYFLIVKSENLLKIRRAIHTAFVKNGGKPEAWDPDHYYPHITIGYTVRDLHEADGLLKDVANSCDSRFKIQLNQRSK